MFLFVVLSVTIMNQPILAKRSIVNGEPRRASSKHMQAVLVLLESE